MEPSGVNLFPRHALVAALMLTLIAGCQSPGASTPITPTASAAAPSSAPTNAPTDAPTPGLTGLFHIVGDAPVVARTAFPNRGAVLPSAISVAEDRTFHAWVIAFAATPGTQEIHHLTSPDATTWTDVPDASLEGLSEGLGNPGAMPTSVLAGPDGWIMHYVGSLVSEPQGWDIWRATAPGPNGPWTKGDEPVVRRGPAGSWDSAVLDFPTVIERGGGYTMFYSGLELAHRDRGSIGRATSDDGIFWTKADAPVAEPGLCGGFDDRAIHQPRVLVQVDRLVMAYAGYAGALDSHPTVGFADSTDGGLTWSCEGTGSGLATAGLPDGFVHTLAAFHQGDRVALLVEWFAGNGTDIWLARLGQGTLEP
ncbi:MAG: hypothetical protein ABIZ52_05995 [Candidatus Limnocylindrales bacterium]